jgi:uncharacterized membrane protein
VSIPRRRKGCDDWSQPFYYLIKSATASSSQDVVLLIFNKDISLEIGPWYKGELYGAIFLACETESWHIIYAAKRMTVKNNTTDERYDPEPRWLAGVVLLVLAGLYTALPSHLIVGPRWGFFIIVVALMIPTIAARYLKYHLVNQVLGFIENGVVTLGMIASVVLLISGLPSHREQPAELLLSAAALWLTNVLVFALWYWRLDAGGPHGRDKRRQHDEGAFLFPQMALHPDQPMSKIGWKPNFLDYLFLAFNTSTAFSPTDVPVLTRWAKVLMMIQSLISLTVLALLAARAVNIL